MKRFLLVLAILFISGIIAADLCVQELQGKDILTGPEVFKGYAYSKVAFKNVVWNILYERGKLMVCLLILFLTPLRNKMPVIFFGVFSFCFGFFMMNCILALNFVGIIVAIASVIPHGLLYMGVFGVLFQSHPGRGYRSTEKIPQKLATYLFLLLLFITGCVMECVMGIHFIPWVIRLSLV